MIVWIIQYRYLNWLRNEINKTLEERWKWIKKKKKVATAVAVKIEAKIKSYLSWIEKKNFPKFSAIVGGNRWSAAIGFGQVVISLMGVVVIYLALCRRLIVDLQQFHGFRLNRFLPKSNFDIQHFADFGFEIDIFRIGDDSSNRFADNFQMLAVAIQSLFSHFNSLTLTWCHFPGILGLWSDCFSFSFDFVWIPFF